MPQDRYTGFTRRRHLLGAFASALLADLPPPISAMPKHIRLLSTLAAGSATDVLFREMAEIASSRLGVGVLVDNRPGAGGLVAARALAKAPADGSTLALLAQSQFAANQSGGSKQLLRSLVPVMRVANTPCFIGVLDESSIRSLHDLFVLARNSPVPLLYGTGGHGTPGHVAIERMCRSDPKLRLSAVPFRTVGESLQALRRGDLAFVSGIIASALGLIRGAHIRLLAVTSGERLPMFKDVPGIGELGYPQYVFDAWSGLFAPRDTPLAAIAQLADALSIASHAPRLLALADSAAIELRTSVSAQQFRDEIRADLQLSVSRER